MSIKLIIAALAISLVSATAMAAQTITGTTDTPVNNTFVTRDNTGTVKATTFSGSGSGLTNLPAGQLTGNINSISIGATTPSSGAFTTLSVTGTLTDGFSSVGTAGQVLSSTGTKLQWIAAGTGAGTVTSVATNATLTGGPITTTGTLSLNLANANTWTANQSIFTAGSSSLTLGGNSSAGSLVLNDGGATSKTAIINAATQTTGGKTASIPNLAANDTFGMLGVANTFTAANTFSNAGNSFTGNFNGSVGATTPSTGAFTTLSTSGLATLTDLTVTNTITGSISGNAANVTGVVALNHGGTGTAAASANAAFNALSPITTLGDLIFGSAVNTATRLAGNTTATKNFLTQTGTGAASAAPVWGTIANTDVSGLGTMSTQAASGVAITGGTISGVAITTGSISNTPIGATPNTGAFTTLAASTSTTLNSNATTTVPATINGLNGQSANLVDFRVNGALLSSINSVGNFSGTAATATTATTATTAANLSGSNLSGDVTNVANAVTVATVGTSTAANIHSAELAANAATSANTASTIVKRDGTGNFSAGTITAALSGNATTATTAANLSGSNLSGDVTNVANAVTVATVGTSTAANIHSAELAANAATSANTASTIVKRDAAGSFSAGAITASGAITSTGGNVGITAPIANALKLTIKNTFFDDSNATNKIELLNSVGGALFSVSNLGKMSLSGIDATPIGATTASTGAFTTLTSNGNSTIGTGAGLTNTFGAGGAALNTIGNATGTNTVNGTTNFGGTVTHGANSVTGSAIAFTGGSINNVTVGATTANTGAFTTLTSNAASTIGTGANLTNSFGAGGAALNTIGNATGTNTVNGTTNFGGTVTHGANSVTGSAIAFTGGSINNVTVGATTANTGAFTTLTSTGNSTLGTANTALANSFGTGANAANVINTIGSTGGGTSLTTINGATTINGGTITLNDGSTSAVNILTNTTSGNLSVGTAAAYTGTVAIASNTGASSVTIGNKQSTAVNVNALALGINDATAAATITNIGTGSTTGAVNIGTGATTQTVTIGRTAGKTVAIIGATSINDTAGTNVTNIGTGGTVGNITIGSVQTGATSLYGATLNLNDASGISTTTNIGTGNAVNGPINIGTGTSTQTIAIGNAVGKTFSLTSPNWSITSGGVFTGSFNGSVGATTPNTGAFTTLSASTSTTLNSNAIATVPATINGFVGQTANLLEFKVNNGAALSSINAAGNFTGNAANVTGTVAIANGGTGQITANAAFNALAPSQATFSGKILTTDGTNTSWTSAGTGTVTSVATNATLSGGPITTSGTLSLNLGNANTWTASQTFPTVALTTNSPATPAANTVYKDSMINAWANVKLTATVISLNASFGIATFARSGTGVYTLTLNNTLTNATNGCVMLTCQTVGYIGSATITVVGATTTINVNIYNGGNQTAADGSFFVQVIQGK